MKTLLLLSILLFSACSVFDNEQDIENSDIITAANDPIFSVLNKSEKPIVFIVIEIDTSFLVDLANPCTDFRPNLLPKSSIQLNYSEILGWDENSESIWFYWTDCNGSGESKTIKL